MRCQATTQQAGISQRYNRGGGPCQREATYTDGENYYCTQHAKEFATPLKKATNKIRAGLQPIVTSTSAGNPRRRP